jgi:hypothetical protein
MTVDFLRKNDCWIWSNMFLPDAGDGLFCWFWVHILVVLPGAPRSLWVANRRLKVSYNAWKVGFNQLGVRQEHTTVPCGDFMTHGMLRALRSPTTKGPVDIVQPTTSQVYSAQRTLHPPLQHTLGSSNATSVPGVRWNSPTWQIIEH